MNFVEWGRHEYESFILILLQWLLFENDIVDVMEKNFHNPKIPSKISPPKFNLFIMIIYFFIAAFLIRMVSLFISIRNEKRLKAEGAIEYGKTNSLILTLAHVAFYSSALIELLQNQPAFNYISLAGLLIFIFSMIALFAVINALGPIWTVKLIISPKQIVVKSFLFKIFRHPNYFLNVIPELIGIALLCQSFKTLLFGLPIYLIPLFVRIRQEESIMKAKFVDYK